MWQLYFQVRLSLFTNREEVMFIEFNTTGTTTSDFFKKQKIIRSSYVDIANATGYFTLK